MAHARQVALTLALTALLACGPSEEEGDETVQGVEETANAAACVIKKYGFYKSSDKCLCYYAEAKKVCGKTVYSYMRDLVTNDLVTKSGALWAHSCFKPEKGRNYRGQYAIGEAAGDKDPETFQSLDDYALLPREDPNDGCPK